MSHDDPDGYDKQQHVHVSTLSNEEVSSPDEVGSNLLRSRSNEPKLKSILDNAHEVLPSKAPRSGSESGFKAALKATFLPPPAPGRQIKVKDGKPLGKTFQRTEPLPDGFEGGQVLDYDPRGERASAGDGVLPPGSLKPPPFAHDRRSSTGESSYGSDPDSSLGSPPSEAVADSDYSQSYTSDAGSAWGSSSVAGSSERGRSSTSHPNRIREGSIASTTSNSSGAAIKFAPLPRSGRLKRANSITIGVAARSHLLSSQGTAAPPRPSWTPQHVHGSQSWYTNSGQQPRADDVVDVGEEIRKSASKAWKLIRGGDKNRNGTPTPPQKKDAPSPPQSQTDQMAAAKASQVEQPHKTFPKEGAPIADPETGELKVANGPAMNTPKISQTQVSEEAKKGATPKHSTPSVGGEETPRRSDSPAGQLHRMAISEEPGAEEAAAALEAAHAKNAARGAHLPNGHHPHELEEGPQHNTFDLADEHDGALLDSGAATPRQRRLSTGAFLRGLSLRGIQEDRRRNLLGLDQGEADDNAVDAEQTEERQEARKRASGEGGRRGIAVRTPAGQEEELGLEGYGHSHPRHAHQASS